MLLEEIGSFLAASSCGQYVSETISADGTQQAIQPARALVWDSSIGRKIVRPLSAVAWDAFSGSVDGRIAGYVVGTALSAGLVGSAFFHGDHHDIMVVAGMATGLYGVVVMGELGGLLGGSIAGARSIYKVVKG